MDALWFTAAGLTVEVRSALPEVTRALRALFRPALLPKGPALRHYTVEADGTTCVDGKFLTKARDPSRCVLRIEGDVLEALGQASRDKLILHTGGVVFEGTLFLFVGEPTAGKSTMTRAALLRGATYLTDDTLIFDEQLCRGVARSVHFDPFPLKELGALPSYYADCDLESYRFRGEEDEVFVTPLWTGAFETLHEYRAENGRVVLASLERGEEEKVTELSVLERAATLLGASLEVGVDRWALVPPGPSYRVTWNREPERALTLLVDAVERQGAP